jgi:hypothetical protein
MRAIPFVVLTGLLLLVALAWTIASGGRVRASDPHRYRPRQGHRAGGPAFDDEPANEAAQDGPAEPDAVGPTDFFTGATLDPDHGIIRCDDCRALYHPDTVMLLDEHNGGRCASCGGTALHPLARPRRWADEAGPRRDRALVPQPASAEAYAAAVGRLVTVEAVVLRALPGRVGAPPGLLVRDAVGITLRLAFVGDAARRPQGRARAMGLLGSRVRASGLLLHDEAFGLRLLVVDPSNVTEAEA